MAKDWYGEVTAMFPRWNQLYSNGFYNDMSIITLHRIYYFLRNELEKILYTILLAQTDEDIKALKAAGFPNLFDFILGLSLKHCDPPTSYFMFTLPGEGRIKIYMGSDGLLVDHYNKLRGESPSESNQMTYTGGDVFTSYPLALYAARLYRSRFCINILDVKDFVNCDLKPTIMYSSNVVPIPKYHDLKYNGITRDEYGDSLLIQILFTIACYQREIKLQNNLVSGHIYCVYAWLDETTPKDAPLERDWSKRSLKDVDYWSYEIGDTTLYIKPMKVIFKLFLWTKGNKFTRTRIFNIKQYVSQSAENPQKLVLLNVSDRKLSIEGDFIEFFQSYVRGLHIELCDQTLINKITTFLLPLFSITYECADPYFILQSPHFFGKYMYPPDLTPKSKITTIGVMN